MLIFFHFNFSHDWSKSDNLSIQILCVSQWIGNLANCTDFPLILHTMRSRLLKLLLFPLLLCTIASYYSVGDRCCNKYTVRKLRNFTLIINSWIFREINPFSELLLCNLVWQKYISSNSKILGFYTVYNPIYYVICCWRASCMTCKGLNERFTISACNDLISKRGNRILENYL